VKAEVNIETGHDPVKEGQVMHKSRPTGRGRQTGASRETVLREACFSVSGSTAMLGGRLRHR